MSDPRDLTGKVALVTGANTGIGAACAMALARDGAEVICAARRPPEETLAAIAEAGGRARALHLDFADPMAARDVFAADPVDILVNNAGSIRRGDALSFSEEDWDAIIDLNLKAVFFTSQAFARAAVARKAGGRIVNIASLLSFQGGILIASYTAAKHGLAGITKLLGNEWAEHGIAVNAVAPGYVVTNNTAALRADPARNAALTARIPLGRWAEPSEIAEAVVFLASPAASYVQGAVLNVDGGWLAR